MKELPLPEIDQRRSKLYPAFKAAKDKNLKAKLVIDKLIIEGQKYTVNSMDKLPKHLQTSKISIRRTDKAALFYGENACFSNFYRANLMVNEKHYTSVEQYFQYQRAHMAGKEDIASKILKTQDPKEQHQLGKTIKPDLE